ncbi:hypothetical protein LZ30DRAFT_714675 [Colletotrichum cereale]|nr:hypothetical protein LZ30DRAFT_714675 [Colletotrichum cereale]
MTGVGSPPLPGEPLQQKWVPGGGFIGGTETAATRECLPRERERRVLGPKRDGGRSHAAGACFSRYRVSLYPSCEECGARHRFATHKDLLRVVENPIFSFCLQGMEEEKKEKKEKTSTEGKRSSPDEMFPPRGPPCLTRDARSGYPRAGEGGGNSPLGIPSVRPVADDQ